MSSYSYDFKVNVEGNKLHEIRVSLKMSQKRFCEVIGYSHSTLNFCDYIALGKPLTKSMQEKDGRGKTITNVTAERIANNLQLPVDEIFPKYNECAAKRLFPFATIDERNAAIEAFYPCIDEMVSKHWWKTYGSDMEELRDVALLTLVEATDKMYKRGIAPRGKDYVKNPWPVCYTEFDGYFIRAIRNSWFNTRRNRRKTSSYTFNSDEKTNNSLFEKMLYNNTERII